MINVEISKNFAEFVISNLENKNSEKSDGFCINKGVYNGIGVVVIEDFNNELGKIKTLEDVYVSLLVEYLDLIAQ